MRIISCHLENFASYKVLDFSFDKQGLTLIQGATGSGKSTLCDAIPWVLFGRTAKDGAADEVVSWSAQGPTYGHIILDMGDYSLWIARTRKPNDLYYVVDGVWEHPRRGKDLNDTQRLINGLLGINADLYLASAYFHEFSQTAQFFTATAKSRRAICEQLVDLSLAKTLQVKLSEQSKALSKKEQEYAASIRLYENLLTSSSALSIDSYRERAKTFEADKAANLEKINRRIQQLSERIKPDSYFQEQELVLKAKRSKLSQDRCSECGGPKHSDKHQDMTIQLVELKQQIAENETHKMTLREQKQRLAKEKTSENTCEQMADKIEADMVAHRAALADIQEAQKEFEVKQADIELLLEVVNDLRGVTITNTIQQLENQTNQILSNHFDAEIKVIFEVVDADKLDVTILKDGNAASYTQLSKGQRQLLKLAFGVSVMRQVGNHHGIKNNCIFADELTDGLDESMKVKAFGLLQELSSEYESVFLVEHSESLKSLFDNKYTVTLVNGNSVIEK